MKLTACIAPQSDVTKPLKPISSRRILVRRRFVAAGKGAVEAVVGAHDRRDVGLDRGIERRYIDLVQRLIVDVGARRHQSRSRHSA